MGEDRAGDRAHARGGHNSGFGAFELGQNRLGPAVRRIAGTGVVGIGTGIGSLAGEVLGGFGDEGRRLVNRWRDIECLLYAVIAVGDD